MGVIRPIDGAGGFQSTIKAKNPQGKVSDLLVGLLSLFFLTLFLLSGTFRDARDESEIRLDIHELEFLHGSIQGDTGEQWEIVRLF